MLSKPVVGFTSHVATPDTVPPQDIQTNVNYQQQTMRFRKCHDFAEPVDVTKTMSVCQSTLSNRANDSMPYRHTGAGDYSQRSSCSEGSLTETTGGVTEGATILE